MRRNGFLCLAVASVALAGCGGSDEDDGASDQEQAAREAVIATIAAFEAEDYAAMCELQDARVNESIPAIAKTDTCAEGYEKLFANQKRFGGVNPTSDTPFDDFVDQLGDYEVGDATVTDEDGVVTAEVALEGPQEALSIAVEEDGEMKVSELFVTPNAGAPQAGSFGG